MKRGFTIIELLVAITIIGILLAAAGLKFNQARATGRDTLRISDTLLISVAVEQAAITQGGSYPILEATWGRSKTVRGSTNSVFCSYGLLGPSGSNGNNVPLGLFRNNSFPLDPSSLWTAGDTTIANHSNPSCPNALFGYTYHSTYVAPLTNTAAIQCYDMYNPTSPSYSSFANCQKDHYTLEVALENERAPGDTVLKSVAAMANSSTSPFYNYDVFTDYPDAKGKRFQYILNGSYCGDACWAK